MKTIKALFLLVLPLISITSCSDSDDIPEVSVNADFSGYYQVPNDATIYITPDCNLTVNSLSIVSLEGKSSSLGNVAYFANGNLFYRTALAPYSTTVPMNFFQKGTNYLNIQMNILVEGYSVYDATMFCTVVLVDNEEDLPSGASYIPASSDNSDDSGGGGTTD